MWPLLSSLVDDKFLTSIEPAGISMQLARGWMRGDTYRQLFDMAAGAEASKPWGANERRKVTEADVLQFLEGCLGFDCPLVVAAVGQFLFGATGLNDADAEVLNEFQKSLAYGLPSSIAVSIYESGLADRQVAQDVALNIWLTGYEGTDFCAALDEYREVVAVTLSAYPSYFRAVLDSL